MVKKGQNHVNVVKEGPLKAQFLTLKQLTHNLQVVAFAPFGLSVDLAFVDARVFRLCMVNLKQPVVPEIRMIEKV